MTITTSKDTTHLCIYHANCNDGFAAALAVYIWAERNNIKVKYQSAAYGDTVPNVEGLHVIIVDFSYDRKTTIELYETAKTFILLDHHETAYENLVGLPYCIFDQSKSGAVIAWEYFNTGLKIPNLIKHVQDRDLWKFEIDNTKEVHCGLQLLSRTFEAWMPYLDNVRITELIVKGSVIIELNKQHIKRIVNGNNIQRMDILGYNVPVVNTNILMSDVGHELSKNEHFSITYFDTSCNRCYKLISNNSRTGNPIVVDVSVIAKSFGGGGHKHAAGFIRPISEVNDASYVDFLKGGVIYK